MKKESIQYDSVDYIVDNFSYDGDVITFEVVTSQSFNFKYNFGHQLKSYDKVDKKNIQFEYNEFLLNFIKNMMDNKSKRFLDDKNLAEGKIEFKVIDHNNPEYDEYGEVESVVYGIKILKYSHKDFKFKWYCEVKVIDMLVNPSEEVVDMYMIEKFIQQSGMIAKIKEEFSKYTQVFMKDHMSMYVMIMRNVDKEIKRPIAFYVEEIGNDLISDNFDEALNILDKLSEEK